MHTFGLVLTLLMLVIPAMIFWKYDFDFKKLSYYIAFLLIYTATFGLPSYSAYKTMKISVILFSAYGCLKYWQNNNLKTACIYMLIIFLFFANLGIKRSDWQAIDILAAIVFLGLSHYNRQRLP